MITVARTDTSTLGAWWWTVDRWSLVALGLIMGFGAVLILGGVIAAAGWYGNYVSRPDAFAGVSAPMDTLLSDGGDDPLVAEFADFIEASQRGITPYYDSERAPTTEEPV